MAWGSSLTRGKDECNVGDEERDVDSSFWFCGWRWSCFDWLELQRTASSIHKRYLPVYLNLPIENLPLHLTTLHWDGPERQFDNDIALPNPNLYVTVEQSSRLARASIDFVSDGYTRLEKLTVCRFESRYHISNCTSGKRVLLIVSFEWGWGLSACVVILYQVSIFME